MWWIDKVLKFYPFGSLLGVIEGGGTANLNLVVETEKGKFFLKCRRPQYASRERIIFEDAFQNHLKRKGLPVYPSLKTKEGKNFVTWEDRVFQLYPYVEGDIFSEENFGELIEVSRVLGRFHLAANSFSPPVPKELPRYDDPKIMREKLEKVRKIVKKEEGEKIDFLINLTLGIEKKLPDKVYHSLPHTYFHGDFHPVNLKFQEGKLVGIFDFDWVSLQPRLRDIADGILFFASLKKEKYQTNDIASLTQAVNFDLKRTKTFLQFYEESAKILSTERKLLPWFIRARWLNCRIEGMRKVPKEKRIPYLLKDIFKPLNSLEKIENKIN